MFTNAYEKCSHIFLPFHYFLWCGIYNYVIFYLCERRLCSGLFLQSFKSILYYNQVPSRYLHKSLSGANKKASRVRLVVNIALVFCISLYCLLVQKTMLGIRSGSHSFGNLCQSNSPDTYFWHYIRLIPNLILRLINKLFHKISSLPEAA